MKIFPFSFFGSRVSSQALSTNPFFSSFGHFQQKVSSINAVILVTVPVVPAPYSVTTLVPTLVPYKQLSNLLLPPIFFFLLPPIYFPNSSPLHLPFFPLPT